MFSTSRPIWTAGGPRARRLLVVAGLALALAPAMPSLQGQALRPALVVTKCEAGYEIEAAFDVAVDPSTVRSVLTDYEHIPQFMPQIRRSVVVDRGPARATVEQEAVAQMLMFTTRVHLVLDITESPDGLLFHDVSAASFTRYEGAWRLASRDGATSVSYSLVAQPRFNAPNWVLTRVMKRDSARMVEQLQREAVRRSRAATR